MNSYSGVDSYSGVGYYSGVSYYSGVGSYSGMNSYSGVDSYSGWLMSNHRSSEQWFSLMMSFRKGRRALTRILPLVSDVSC